MPSGKRVGSAWMYPLPFRSLIDPAHARPRSTSALAAPCGDHTEASPRQRETEGGPTAIVEVEAAVPGIVEPDLVEGIRRRHDCIKEVVRPISQLAK